MVFPKKNRTGKWSFLLHYLERWFFFFPKIWFYSLDKKWKMIFLQKNTWKYDIILQMPRKESLSKKNMALEYDLSCIIWKDRIFHPENTIFCLWTKDDLSQEIHGNMIFSVYMYKCYKYDIILQKKIKGDLLPKKYTYSWLTC